MARARGGIFSGSMFVFPSEKWNAWAAQVRRAWPLPGLNCKLEPRRDGVVVNAEVPAAWEHPWQVTARCDFDDKGNPKWRASVRPGFVNGRDAFIPMPADWPEKGDPARRVPLTSDPAPWLALQWRNPLSPSGISATASGEIVYGKGEGYPPFFAALGVAAPAPGGRNGDAPFDPLRTRQIRACDIALTQPRIGTRLDVLPGNPFLGEATRISTVFTTDYWNATGGRATLRAVAKFISVAETTTELGFGTLLRGEDPQFEEIKIATVWLVSPPDAGSDAEPDQSWEPFAQHAVFWNLSFASRLILPSLPYEPLRVQTGLPLADMIANAQLTLVNEQYAEISAFMSQGDARGKFWSA